MSRVMGQTPPNPWEKATFDSHLINLKSRQMCCSSCVKQKFFASFSSFGLGGKTKRLMTDPTGNSFEKSCIDIES